MCPALSRDGWYIAGGREEGNREKEDVLGKAYLLVANNWEVEGR